MKLEYTKAFTEVYEIFKLMPKELLNKIPEDFIKIIEEERDVQYKPEIKEPIEDQNLKDETVVILSLIYRDFLCDKEKRIELQEKDAKEIQIVEEDLKKELEEKYNPDNIFKNNKIQVETPTEETSMITVQEEKWYKKILKIIKKLFNKN